MINGKLNDIARSQEGRVHLDPPLDSAQHRDEPAK